MTILLIKYERDTFFLNKQKQKDWSKTKDLSKDTNSSVWLICLKWSSEEINLRTFSDGYIWSK